VIEEQERRIVDQEKLVVGQLDHIAEVTCLVDQVMIAIFLNLENVDNCPLGS